MRLGAHVSVAGSLDLAIDRAVEIGCECIQIFVGNPRQWRPGRHAAKAKAEFRRKYQEAGLDPVVAHSCYLINLASPHADGRRRSVTALIQAMRAMEELEGLGVVTHIGSPLGGEIDPAIERVGRSIEQVLERTETAVLLLENSAGGTLGRNFDELNAMLVAVDWHPRVEVCLDTAHLFGAGFDIRTAKGVRSMLDEFDKKVGLERLRLFHLNDSRAELGSRLDRHENIGEGTIGPEGFRALLNDRRVRGIGGVLETPGFDRKGPDEKNMSILRSLEKRGGGAAKAGAGEAPGRPETETFGLAGQFPPRGLEG
jgi:deoxyribonuclease-4